MIHKGSLTHRSPVVGRGESGSRKVVVVCQSPTTVRSSWTGPFMDEKSELPRFFFSDLRSSVVLSGGVYGDRGREKRGVTSTTSTGRPKEINL